MEGVCVTAPVVLICLFHRAVFCLFSPQLSPPTHYNTAQSSSSSSGRGGGVDGDDDDIPEDDIDEEMQVAEEAEEEESPFKYACLQVFADIQSHVISLMLRFFEFRMTVIFYVCSMFY